MRAGVLSSLTSLSGLLQICNGQDLIAVSPGSEEDGLSSASDGPPLALGLVLIPWPCLVSWTGD